MTGKYTIKLNPNLHQWFKLAAIIQGRTLSELVTDAMEAYKKSDSCRLPDGLLLSKTTKIQNTDSLPKAPKSKKAIECDDAATNTGCQELKGPYVRSFYKPGTHELNETGRAKLISKTAKQIESMLIRAGPEGIAPSDLHATLDSKGIGFGLRRDTLSYLGHHKLVFNGRSKWVHTTHRAATTSGNSRRGG